MIAFAARPAPAPALDELDAVTLRRAQKGDAAACRALVERYQRRVFALLHRMLGERAWVEDVAQETFLDVFRALAGFSALGAARLSTWILTIASRRAIDALRRQPPAPVALELAGVAGPARADRGAEQAQLAARVERAVRALAPEQRATLLLREYHDFDYAEIARALGCDLGTVKSRLSRARGALRIALADISTEVPDE